MKLSATKLKRVQDALTALSSAQTLVSSANVEMHLAICDLHGLQEGVTRVLPTGRTLDRYGAKPLTVCKVQSSYGTTQGKPWVSVHLPKKDGTDSQVIRNLYDNWQHVEPYES